MRLLRRGKGFPKKLTKNEQGEGLMLITKKLKTKIKKQKFLPNVKPLIASQKVLCRWSHKCAQNENCGFIPIYVSLISDILIPLSSVYIYGLIYNLQQNNFTENKKPSKAIQIPTKYKNFSQKNIKLSSSYITVMLQESCAGG